jgi:hypothetical protein
MNYLKWWNFGVRREGKLPYADPLHAGRHPFQTFLLALCVVSGIPQLFGRTTAESVEAQLPLWLVTAWGGCLVVGAILGLVGAHVWRRDYATALTLERVGLYLAGAAAVVYSILVARYAGISGALAGSIILAFGLACIRRGSDIGLIFHRALNPDDSPEIETEEGR